MKVVFIHSGPLIYFLKYAYVIFSSVYFFSGHTLGQTYREILQNFVTFSEYMNFKGLLIKMESLCGTNVPILRKQNLVCGQFSVGSLILLHLHSKKDIILQASEFIKICISIPKRLKFHFLCLYIYLKN